MLNKLKKIFSQPTDDQDKTSKSAAENRLHTRYGLDNLGFLRLEFPLGHSPHLRDISYGGFSLSKRASVFPEMSGSELKGVLHLFDGSCPIKAKKVYEDREKIGLEFIHDSEQTLIFLRHFLENVRCGASLTTLDSSLLNENFQKKYSIAMRGDGPVDIYMNYQDGQLLSALMTIRADHKYVEVRLAKGQFSTGRVMDSAGSAPRMVTDERHDRDVLRIALQILAGCLLRGKKGLEAVVLLYTQIDQLLQEVE